jgi:hypothetical protein
MSLKGQWDRNAQCHTRLSTWESIQEVYFGTISFVVP